VLATRLVWFRRLEQLNLLPLQQRLEPINHCFEHSKFLLQQPTLIHQHESATLDKLRGQESKQAASRAGLLQKLQQAEHALELTRGKIEAEESLVQQQQAAQATTLLQLNTQFEAAHGVPSSIGRELRNACIAYEHRPSPRDMCYRDWHR
jgi:hypothetical protein